MNKHDGRIRFLLPVLALLMLVGFVALAQDAEARKGPVINTRGACLTAEEFKALIQHESRRMKSGEILTLIVDIPNEAEVREAIKGVGFPVVEETRDQDRDSITYLLQVKK